ncbi:hypothetical protein [Nocardia sp. NPDC005998]|uniref:hypothetical protein n=1 Tax=Nocardia sp. NPDC005998 TaxID=3156894 RepID=UPI0033A8FB78
MRASAKRVRPKAAFVLVELRTPQPSFDPRLLAQRLFGRGNAALGLLLFAMTAASFYSAFYLPHARGFSPLPASSASSPAALGVIVGGPLGRDGCQPTAVPV